MLSSLSSSSLPSSAASEGRRDAEKELNLPPGFRFHPTDEELVVHYLCRKAAGASLPVPIIADLDLYKHDPWELPEKALFGQREWYFFTPRDRKYPNGSRPNRAAGSGYWKATGADKPVSAKDSGRTVGIKKALVFYTGKAPRGIKTDWIMHEYRLIDSSRGSGDTKKVGLRLDNWVLCRLYHKKNIWDKEQRPPAVAAVACTSEMEPAQRTDRVVLVAKQEEEEGDWFREVNLEDLQVLSSRPGWAMPPAPAAGDGFVMPICSPGGMGRAGYHEMNMPLF